MRDSATRRTLEQYLQSLRRAGDAVGASLCLRKLGGLSDANNRLSEATALYLQALTELPEDASDYERGSCHYLIGEISARQERPETAATHLEQARQHFKQCARIAEEAMASRELAAVCEAPRATELLFEAFNLFIDAELPYPAIDSLLELGERHRLLKELPALQLCIDKAAELLEMDEGQTGFAELLLKLSRLCTLTGDRARAMSSAKEARKRFRRISDSVGEAKSLWVEGEMLGHSGEIGPAIKKLKKAQAMFHQQRDEQRMAGCAMMLGLLHAQQGDLDSANGQLSRALNYTLYSGADRAFKQVLDNYLLLITRGYRPGTAQKLRLSRLRASARIRGEQWEEYIDQNIPDSLKK